jgi:hypothetical protein
MTPGRARGGTRPAGARRAMKTRSDLMEHRSLSPADPGSAGAGRDGPGHGRRGAGDHHVHELRAAAGRQLPPRRGLHTGRQPHLRARGAAAGHAGRRQVRAVQLGHGGRHRGVPGAAARRPRAGLPGPVLGGAQVAGRVRAHLGLDGEFTDTADPAAVSAAIRPGRTRLLWLETPANPMWEITDLAAVCELAHRAGSGWQPTTRSPPRY